MGRIADVMARARAAGWGPSREDAWWEHSTSKAALEALEGFPVDRAVVERPVRPVNDGWVTERAVDVPRVVTSAAKPLQQYMAALVQRIFLTPEAGEDAIRSVVFAGVDVGPESALLSAASAEILANSVAGRVCLIDANFTTPSLHRLYGASNDVGFAQLLTGDGQVREYAKRLSSSLQNSFWLLPAGTASPATASQLASELNPARFRDLLNAFDYLVFDAPEVTHKTTAAVLGGQVDGVVLVTEANVTRRHVARAASDAMRAAGVRVLGSVLNNRTFPIPESLYRRL